MALTALVRYRMRPRGRNSYPVADTVRIYHGALVATNGAGFLTNAAGTAGNKFQGIAEVTDQQGTTNPGSILGTASATPECPVDESGAVLENVSVAGVTAQADVNTLVYASDENTLTVTAAANLLVGKIVRWRATTFCDVALFAPTEHD